jgi:hypothetical protein
LDAWGGSWGTSWGTSWGAGAVVEQPAPAIRSGGLPLSEAEWYRRKRAEDRETETEDAPPQPRIVELIGAVEPGYQAPPLPDVGAALRHAELTGELTRSQLRRMQRKAKRRRDDDDWFLLN